MSHSDARAVDRRSTRRLQSQNSEKTSQNINQHVDSTDPEKQNFSTTTQKHVHVKVHDEDDLILSKSEEEKETLNQIENIPDNTQVISLKYESKGLNVTETMKPEKKEYKKKQMKQGVTDREWLGSKEHKEKWTALDAKRGMCNDCKKVFSSRQALRYHCEASRDCFRMGKFCREEHQHHYISKEFKSLDEIMDWMHAEELDTQFSCKGGYTSFEAAAKHRRMPNKIYWCNKNPRTKSYVPKRGEKSSSRKLPPGQRCPAIIQIRAHEVFSNPKEGTTLSPKKRISTIAQNDEKPIEDGKSNSQPETQIVWRVKGCLTHSHKTDDTGKTLRLSKRVRKNIGLLLKLDLPMQIIRNKYLKMENFGGASGKVPSIESARQIQLATYPAPPDLSCPEMEIVFRYMRYNLSVRAFNFIRPGVPSSANPTSGIRNSAKEPDSSTGLLERDNLARAVQADEVIVVFMDEDQRKIFRDSSGTIIVSSIDSIYSLEGYQFVSVSVLDFQGEATPVCQAISANELNTTSRIMLETMKILEPSSVCRIHCLMAPQPLEEPFIQALSQTLAPNSELITYPLQPVWVETYVYIIQSSLKPIVTRLDQLIYAVFKMNEFLQYRRERFLCGFYGKHKSRVQKLFASLNETPNQKESVRFEIVEATTRDVREDELDFSAKQPIENPAWEITKFDGEVLVESNLVSAFPKGKLFCDEKTCQVYFDVCKKDQVSDTIPYVEGIPCCHSLSCDCADYSRTYNCIHIYLVTKYIVSQKTTRVPSDIRPLFDNKENSAKEKSDHNYTHDQGTGNENSDPTDTANSQDDQDKINSVRPCQVKLQKLEDIDLNKALSTPFLKKLDPHVEENELLEEAINKLTSAVRYLRGLKEKQGEPKANPSGDINGPRKSGRKRKRPHLKNVCLDVIEFIESNFPGNSNQTNLLSTKKEETKQSDTKHNVTSEIKNVEYRNDKLEKSLREEITDSLNDSKNLTSKNKKSFSHQIIGMDIPRQNLLKVALHANVNDISWCTLACGNYDKNLEMLANLDEFDIDERETILEKFILAKSLWRCTKCKDSNSIESMLSGFIICRLCQHWFHRSCSIGKEPNQIQNSEQVIDDYVCERCMSLFLGHTPTEPTLVEGSVTNQDSLQIQNVTADTTIPINDVNEKSFIVENIETASKLNQGEQQIEFIQTQQATEQGQELTDEQVASGTQIYYQLPPNVTFPTTGEGHYVVQLQGNTVQQIGFEVL